MNKTCLILLLLLYIRANLAAGYSSFPCPEQNITVKELISRINDLSKEFIASGKNETTAVSIIRFFSCHDTIWKNNSSYMLAKLDVLELLNGKELWKKALSEIPDSLLHRPDLVVGRLDERVAGDSAKAIALMRRLAVSRDTEERNLLVNWIHNNFAQAFLPYRSSPYKPRSADFLFGQLAPDRSIYPAVSGLLAWVKILAVDSALKNTVGDSILIHEAFSFLKNCSFSGLSRSERYALLIYKSLVKRKGFENVANNFLDKTIAKLRFSLQKYNTPENTARLKYLLAYGCFERAGAIQFPDSASGRTGFLKEAFGCSREMESAEPYFYDRLFLGGRDEYVTPYINFLEKAGKSDTALALFSKLALDKPQYTRDLEALYNRVKPDSCFRDYWLRRQERALPPAPSFKLARLDSTIFTPGSLKGRWTLIALWGTWCAPSVAELPALEKIQNELRRDSSAGALITVTSGDDMISLNAFLAHNPLSLKICMGDSTFFKRLKVPRFPSKLLLSPSGKILSLAQVNEWENIARLYLFSGNSRFSARPLSRKIIETTSYALTPGQEVVFDPVSDSVSEFWRFWNYDSLHRIHFPEKEQLTSIEKITDCNIVVKSAYGERGLYFLFEISDNNFPGIITQVDRNDAIEFFLKTVTSDSVVKNTASTGEKLINEYFSFGYSAGGKKPIESISLSRFRPINSTPQEEAHDSLIERLSFTRTEAASRYGIRVKRIRKSANTIFQEWFVPWFMAIKAVAGTRPYEGAGCSLAIQYHDIDESESGRVKSMSWGDDGSSHEKEVKTHWGKLVFNGPPAEMITVNEVRRIRADSIFATGDPVAVALSEIRPGSIQKGPLIAHRFLYGFLQIRGHRIACATSAWPYLSPSESIGDKAARQLIQQNARAGGNRLFVIDRNFNNDLGDDRIALWRPEPQDSLFAQKLAQTHFVLDSIVVDDVPFSYYINDGGCLRKAITVRRHDAVEGTGWIGGKEFAIALWDRNMRGLDGPGAIYSLTMAIDLNGDGDLDGRDGSGELFYDCRFPVTIDKLSFVIDHVTEDGQEIYFHVLNEERTRIHNDVTTGARAPLFTTQDTKGRNVSLSDDLAKNDFTLLYFFSEDEGMISSGTPETVNADHRVMNEQLGPTVLTGIANDTVAVHTPFRIIIEDRDASRAISTIYNIRSFPAIICIDKKGIILYRGSEYWLLPALWKKLGRKDLTKAMELKAKYLKAE